MLLLYIVLYGAMLAGGLVNLTLSDALIRLIKVGVISLMFTEAGIQLYFDIVVRFAIDGGMDFLNFVSGKIGSAIGEMNTLGGNHQEIKELLNQIQNADVTTTVDKPLSENTFAAIDSVIAQLLSPQSFAVYSALFFTMNVIKNFIGIALFLSTCFFILAVFRAVYIYVISLLGRVFLLGMGGIFIIFLLFQRTQRIFLVSWFKQLLGYMFAPVFVFTFLSLMAILVNVVYLDIFKEPNGEIKYKVCREKPKSQELLGSLSFVWQFQEINPITGKWITPAKENKDIHVEFFSALVLLALAVVCWFNIESLDELSTQLFGVIPDLQKLGTPKNKSLSLGGNMKAVRAKVIDKPVKRGAKRLGGKAVRGLAGLAGKLGGGK